MVYRLLLFAGIYIHHTLNTPGNKAMTKRQNIIIIFWHPYSDIHLESVNKRNIINKQMTFVRSLDVVISFNIV